MKMEEYGNLTCTYCKVKQPRDNYYNNASSPTGKVRWCKECNKLKSVHRQMKKRCADANNPAYGGKGIKVCDRWVSFRNFFNDMGERPEGYQLDRIDNGGNYEPSNCRWTTAHNNAINKNKKWVGIKDDPRKSTFEARITINREEIYLGSFRKLSEAANAYDDACEVHHGTRPNQQLGVY